MSIEDIEKLNKMREEGVITEEEYVKAKKDILDNIANPPSSIPNPFATDPSIPEEIKGLNWGAFFLNWIWGCGNNVWLALISLIPYIGWIMPFVLLFKGNEWAWKNRKFSSVEEFKAVQKAWTTWGIVLTIISIILGVVIGLTFGLLGGVMDY